MIRVVIASVMTVSSNPLRKEMPAVARQITHQYPESLTERLNGDIVGVGYSSPLEQMMHRVKNIKRPVHSSKPAEDKAVDVSLARCCEGTDSNKPKSSEAAEGSLWLRSDSLGSEKAAIFRNCRITALRKQRAMQEMILSMEWDLKMVVMED